MWPLSVATGLTLNSTLELFLPRHNLLIKHPGRQGVGREVGGCPLEYEPQDTKEAMAEDVRICRESVKAVGPEQA